MLARELERIAAADEPKTVDLTDALRSSDIVVPRSQGGQVPLLTNDRGERILPLFSGVETLKLWTKSVPTFGVMLGREAFGMAVSLEVEAVVIDPAGPVRLEFSRDDVRRLAAT